MKLTRTVNGTATNTVGTIDTPGDHPTLLEKLLHLKAGAEQAHCDIGAHPVELAEFAHRGPQVQLFRCTRQCPEGHDVELP